MFLAKDMWDVDEPAAWQKDLTGVIRHWIEVGQPDEKRLMRASSRAGRVSVYSFSASTAIWWSGIQTKITRARNLSIWQVPAAQSQALAGLAARSMELQVTVQDQAIWVGNGERSVESRPSPALWKCLKRKLATLHLGSTGEYEAASWLALGR